MLKTVFSFENDDRSYEACIDGEPVEQCIYADTLMGVIVYHDFDRYNPSSKSLPRIARFGDVTVRMKGNWLNVTELTDKYEKFVSMNGSPTSCTDLTRPRWYIA